MAVVFGGNGVFDKKKVVNLLVYSEMSVLSG
jgi:hypothetical protein